MKIKRILAIALSLSLLLGTMKTVGTVPAFAANKVFRMAQARNMAVASSSDISKKQNELILKQMRYTEAVDGIKAKIKNKETFRWSPLFSFKFPEPLNMVDAYDMTVKPLVLQSEITVTKHQIRDLQHDVLSKVSNQYVKIYITQEKMNFAEARLRLATQQKNRSKSRLLTGQATQSDVDNAVKSVDKLTEELSNLGRDFESGKKELSDMVRIDVTSGYAFQNPMQELNMPRSELQKVIDYTLDNDQGYYEAKMSVSVAMMNLNSYESLLNEKFGKEMRLIRPYITSVRQGKDVDFAAFKIAYKQMLKLMDQPWEGNWSWWFLSFPWDWFKGDVDGTRYIEDEMYAPYTACMEYSNAVKAEVAARKALTKQVERDYNTLGSTFKSYLSFQKTTEKANERMLRTSELNRMGKAESSELQEAVEAYQTAQIDMMDSLTTYNELLNSYDRLTCGAIGRYLSGAGMETDAGVGEMLDTVNEPYYYIYNSVQDMAFQVGISIPKGFVPAINQYELWIGTTQIGTRTDITKAIRHLTLDYGGDPIMKVKLFNNNVFVAESDVDTRIPHERLSLVGAVPLPATRKVIGSYTVEAKQEGDVSTSTLTLTLDASVKAESYNITYPGSGSVYTGEHLPTDMPFTYLTLLIPSLGNVTVELYDKDGKLITEAGFDTVASTITMPVDTAGGTP